MGKGKRRRRIQWWVPRCPTCGSQEVDFAPFTQGREWECNDCSMRFDQSENDDSLE